MDLASFFSPFHAFCFHASKFYWFLTKSDLLPEQSCLAWLCLLKKQLARITWFKHRVRRRFFFVGWFEPISCKRKTYAVYK